MALGCWLLAISLIGCGTKKKAVNEQVAAVVEPEVPAWHTCLIQGARATLRTDEQEISASITLQAVRDSMIVVSIMPFLGMEMIRLEATPTDFILIDKFNSQYLQASYADLTICSTPALTMRSYSSYAVPNCRPAKRKHDCNIRLATKQ